MYCLRRIPFFVVVLYISIVVVSGQTPSSIIGLRPVISGLDSPVYLTNAGDGSNRLFVLEQRGMVKVIQPGESTATVFLDVSPLVSSSGGERGLLGLAFHPQYSINHRFFIFYTRATDGDVVIAEYKTSDTDPNQADPNAVREIITIPHPAENHNGGTILFGPDDGYLYASIGDGTGGNDSANNAQNKKVLLGKIIRIDVDTPVDQVPAYNIPPDNPYVRKSVRGRGEIYALGLRNPYRFSFDREGSHQLWAGDVGQEATEEVDIITRGGNYGWRVYEGSQCSGLDPDLCIPTNFIPPVAEYSHGGEHPRCSIIGGHVYRGPLGTFDQGTYVYADLCSGEIFNLINGTQSVRLDNAYLPTAIGEDESGELYVVSLGGVIHKIVRRSAIADFDGDLRTDVSVYRPSTGTWYILNSSDQSMRAQRFGLDGDVPVSQDVDGDTVSDIGVFRPSTGTWYFYRSSDGTVDVHNFGVDGDIPTMADYDGDQKADLSIYRPSTASWWVFPSSTQEPFQRSFGKAGDMPVVGDYDGDGKSDIGLWRPADGVWYCIYSHKDQVVQQKFGLAGDIPTAGDFDGDGRTDIAVFRPSAGLWYAIHSDDGQVYVTQWGTDGDIPIVGDYDGDGLADISLFRPTDGVWYTIRSSDQKEAYTRFGLKDDIAVPMSPFIESTSQK
jgi:glucose/arabinose dehydrogenase